MMTMHEVVLVDIITLPGQTSGTTVDPELLLWVGDLAIGECKRASAAMDPKYG